MFTAEELRMFGGYEEDDAPVAEPLGFKRSRKEQSYFPPTPIAPMEAVYTQDILLKFEPPLQFPDSTGLPGIEPMAISIPGKPKPRISHIIHEAALNLLEAQEAREIRLPPACMETLSFLGHGCEDEFLRYDPMLRIYDTHVIKETGTRILLQERVPMSTLLLARHFRFTYSIEIVSGVFSPAKLFEQVFVEPSYGEDHQHSNSLHCEAQVNAQLAQMCGNNATQETLVRKSIGVHMAQVGIISTIDSLADAQFWQDQTKAIGALLQRIERGPTNGIREAE